jgi:K+-transporting ATPase ATPase C chain
MISRDIRTAAVLLLGFTVLTGFVYPLLVTGVGALLFPRQAGGSLITKDGIVTGSALIGQPFSRPEYFWGRLSATSPVPYNSAASTGSNYGPLNPALLKAAEDRAAALRAADPLNTAAIPIDLLTASGSGLDPHISVTAALYQLPRIARSRNLPADAVRDLVDRYTDGRDLGFLGEPGVNVLRLNLALDDLRSVKGSN